MPINGRFIEWDRLEIGIISEASGSHSGLGSGAYSHSAQNATFYTPDSVDVAPGMSVAVSSSGSAWSALYRGPNEPFGGYSVGGGSYMGTVSMSAVFLNVLGYVLNTGALLQISCTGIEIYVNGSLSVTLAGFATTSDGCGQAYIPVIGIPSLISASCGASTTGLPGTLPNTFDFESSVTQTVSGGWRFKEKGGSDWISLKVSPPAMSAPSVPSAPFGLSPGGPVASVSTWGTQLVQSSRSRSARSFTGTQFSQTHAQKVCLPAHFGGSSTIVYDQTGPSECILYDGSTGQGYRDVYRATSEGSSASGTVLLWPDLQRSIKRFNSDYGNIIYRDGFPQTLAGRSHSATVGGVTSAASDQIEVHPAYTALLSVITNTPHIIEEPLGKVAYAPSTAAKSQSHIESFEFAFGGGPIGGGDLIACECPPGWAGTGAPCPVGSRGFAWQCETLWPDLPPLTDNSESVGYSFPAAVQTTGANPYIGTYQYHEDRTARYLNFWGNPHWQYFGPWFPPNTIDSDGDGIPDQQSQWQVDGSPIDRNYFMAVREPWLYQSSLPGSEQLRKRASNIASCINESAHTPFLDANCGGQRWLGVSRFLVDEVGIPPSLALTSASSGLWSFTDCTAAFGANIVLTPSGSSIIAKLNLGSFGGESNQLPHICNSIGIDWIGTNISAVQAVLVAADGSTVVLGTTTGTRTRPTGMAAKYAGSWAIDNGAGYVFDTGADFDASGISAATMADPERCFAFQLLPSRTAAELWFEITVTNPANPVTLKYPIFYTPTTHPAVVWESSQCCDLLWPDGPGVRFGSWLWYDPDLGFQDPPLVKGLGIPNSIIDWLCFGYVVFQGVDALTGGSPDLTTRLTQLFDTFEGQSVAQVDQNSIAFPLPKGTGSTIRSALVNTVAEVPPMACFPRKARTTTDWTESGAYSQEAWDWSQLVDHLVSPRSATDEYTPASTIVSSVDTDPATNWKSTSFALALDNTEFGYLAKQASTTWGTNRPWRGYFACGIAALAATTDVDLLQTPSGEHVAVFVSSGDIEYRWGPYSRVYWRISTAITAGESFAKGWARPRVCVDSRWEIHLLAYHAHQGAGDPLASGLYYLSSDDNGNTWTSPALVLAGAAAGMIRCAKGGGPLLEILYVPDSGTSGPGTLKRRWKDLPEGVWSARVTIVDQAASSLRTAGYFFGFDHAAESLDGWWLSFTPESGGDPVTYHCTDQGLTWELQT